MLYSGGHICRSWWSINKKENIVGDHQELKIKQHYLSISINIELASESSGLHDIAEAASGITMQYHGTEIGLE